MKLKTIKWYSILRVVVGLIAEYGPEYGTAMFEQEYNCSWNAAVIGSYYGYLIEELKQKSRIGDFGYDDEHPVYTFWDLGLDDHMAVWFVQFVGDEIRWIDFESGDVIMW